MNDHPEEVKVSIRIKLSALWTSVMFLYIYGDYFELYVPDKTAGLLSGDNMLNTPEKLFLAAALLTLPALMIFLTLLLPSRLSRALNIGVAVFFTLFTLLVGSVSISHWRAFYVFLALLESVVTSLIVWQAWKWGKRPDPILT
ncbi:MAG: hypothetical protein IM638_16550 [Bacteroidetes bacterium]|nr:hypothetical protein [Bacteroidota bacterium]